MNYSYGQEYGYDQIKIDHTDMRDLTSETDANRLHEIDAIRNKETRLFKKIEQYRPKCKELEN